jgi:hypothetical protein
VSQCEGETYLCVGVVGRLEAQVLEAHVGEEVTEEALKTWDVLAELIYVAWSRTYRLV